MRFQPGEPNLEVKSLDVCISDKKQLLVYCSGNNVIICEDGQLLQTIYLPKDGLSVNIERNESRILICLVDCLWVLEPQDSFTRGRTWKHTQTIHSQGAIVAKWLDTSLLVGGNSIQILKINGQKEWQESEISANDFAVSPNGQHFVSIDDSSLVKLWSRVSLSAQNFDFDYLRHPQRILWAYWIDEMLFTWSIDGVLRGFRSLVSSSRFELFVNVQLEKKGCPSLVKHKDSVLVIVASDSGCSMIELDCLRMLVRPEIRLRDIPLELLNARDEFSINDAIFLHAQVDGDQMKFVCHKPSLLLLVSTKDFIAETLPTQVKYAISAIFSGHTKSIRAVKRSSMGYRLFTQSRFDENYVWAAYKLSNGETTIFKNCFVGVNNIVQSDLCDYGLLTMQSSNCLKIWDVSGVAAREINHIDLESEPLLAGFIPHNGSIYVAAIFETNIKLWKVEKGELVPLADASIGAIDKAVMIDPVGWTQTFDRDVLCTITGHKVQTLSVKIDESVVSWSVTSTFDAGQYLDSKGQISKVQVSSREKIAVVQENRLLIWDAANDVVEFDASHDQINDLDWTTTPSGECLLGVGYSTKVIIYCQQRYDYTRKLEAWIPVREIDVSKFTSHTIGDSIWLKDGTFVVGAGNQLFIQDAQVDMQEDTLRQLLRNHNTISSLEQSTNLFEVCAVLNGPLPIYHPQFLIQLIFSGRIEIVEHILYLLLKALKYATIIEPQMIADIDYFLGLDANDLDTTIHSREFNRTIASELEEQLQTKALGYLTRHQQVTLLSVVQSVAQIDNCLDQGATNYMLGYHLFRLHSKTQASMNMRDFVWALTSNEKQILIDEVEKAGATTKLSLFTQFGLMFWLDNSFLVEKAEQLAKRIFAVTRDPVQVTLLYLALKKKQLLVGLWRLSSSNPEQAKTIKLLNNDFESPRWKAAALKNAYALMSKHRYEYAAGLFLLGGSVKDACNVLARQLNDLPLAFLVARLYDGDNGEGMKYLIDRFLSEEDDAGATTDDVYSHRYWMQVWAHMTMGDYKSAVKAATVVRTARAERSMTDPVLLWMYSFLRKRFTLPVGDEMRALTRTAMTYCRMGCDLIALHMCKDWSFAKEGNLITPAHSVYNSAVPSPFGVSAPQTPQMVEPPQEAPAGTAFDLSAFGF